MLKLIFVGLGGFLGSISRYLVSGLVYTMLEEPWLPYGTFAVNITGCFLIGFLSGLAEMRQVLTPEIRLFVFVGFLGSFTTFSTFGYELFTFARDGQFIAALTNLSLHFVLGFGAVWFGFTLSKFV